MKSTYKIFGIYLDGANIPVVPPDINLFNQQKQVQSIKTIYNIIDIAQQHRYVSGSELLTFECYSDVSKCVKNLIGFTDLVVVLDFISKSVTLNVLYLKRLMQLYSVLIAEYENFSITFACVNNRIKIVSDTLQLLYKKSMHSDACNKIRCC